MNRANVRFAATALVGLRPEPFGLGHSATIDFRKGDAPWLT